jgi:hypothetical protein
MMNGKKKKRKQNNNRKMAVLSHVDDDTDALSISNQCCWMSDDRCHVLTKESIRYRISLGFSVPYAKGWRFQRIMILWVVFHPLSNVVVINVIIQRSNIRKVLGGKKFKMITGDLEAPKKISGVKMTWNDPLTTVAETIEYRNAKSWNFDWLQGHGP